MRSSSIIETSRQGGHSSQVTMRLLVDGLSLRIVQMGKDFVFLESPMDHPPATASLVLKVDDSERQWNIRLPKGISASDKRVAIAAL